MGLGGAGGGGGVGSGAVAKRCLWRHRGRLVARTQSKNDLNRMTGLSAIVRQHADSVFALRIVFSICLVLVLLSGVYIFKIRKRLFDRDPEVAADHWAARKLRPWQVILVWLLAIDLLVTMLWPL